MKSGYPSFNHKRRETKQMAAKIELELDWVGARAFRASESRGEISFPWPGLLHLLGTNASVTMWTQREASKKSWTRQHPEATVKGPELPNDDIIFWLVHWCCTVESVLLLLTPVVLWFDATGNSWLGAVEQFGPQNRVSLLKLVNVSQHWKSLITVFFYITRPKCCIESLI